MAINGLSIADNATSIAVTGGTAQVFTPDGVEVKRGQHVAAAAIADFRVRPHISFINENPERKANGVFTMGQRIVKSTEPWIDPITGIVYYVTHTLSARYAPVIPASVVKNGRYKAAQLMFVAGLESFNTSGDLS